MDDRFEDDELGSHMPDLQVVIRACGLCRQASDETILLLEEGCHLAHADRGEILWTAGTVARFVAIVADGMIRLARRAPHAHEVVVELVGPGSCAGILAAVSEGPYALTASAVTPTWYLKLPTSVWRRAMRKEPNLYKSAMEELRHRLLQSYDFLGGMATCAVEPRLAAALLSVHEVFRSPFVETDEALPISRQSLAEIASTSVETVIRTTTKWQNKGWIRAGYRTISILDMEAIRGILA
ncbi:MAG: Crp/Fnr family transcriptional regulator [Armatimonadetes bacterium]|nr:Crp/Fnr family transcriptional regulator [Armatimonadota bacterium]